MTHSTALTLLPCPFCGGAAHCNDFRGGAGYWQVECQDCDATSDGRRVKADAITAWNRRAELAASADAGKLLLKMKVFRSDLDWELRTTPRNEERIKALNVAIDEHLNQLAALARPAPAERHLTLTSDAESIPAWTKAEEARLDETLGRYYPKNAPATMATEAVSAQGDEVDAARYRWLRDECREWEDMTSAWLYEGLDAAVDAARAQQGGQG